MLKHFLLDFLYRKCYYVSEFNEEKKMKKLDTTNQLFTSEKAEEIAETLRKSDPDWKYIVRHDPNGTGFSFIEIYDEDNNFVERF
jgi:hypothetical protein